MGGEPTLQLDIVKYISAQLINYCDANEINYTATMYTNGSRLDELLPCIKDLRINDIQVPIDGYGIDYAKRKAYAYSECSYDQVVDYCKQVLAQGIHLNIRINLDRNNLDTARRAIEDLVEQFGDGDYTIYLAQLSAIKTCSAFFTEEDYDSIVEPLYYYLDSLISIKHKAIRPRFVGCYATVPDSIVIGPNGDLYKCQHCIGNNEQIIGNVREGIIGNEAYYSWCLFEIPEVCRECKYLPLCGGGCAYEHMVMRSSSGPCNRVKYHLESKLEFFYKEIEGIHDE